MVNKPERVSTKQTAIELNMDVDTLQYLFQTGRIPIGYAVKKDGKRTSITRQSNPYRNGGRIRR